MRKVRCLLAVFDPSAARAALSSASMACRMKDERIATCKEHGNLQGLQAKTYVVEQLLDVLVACAISSGAATLQ